MRTGKRLFVATLALLILPHVAEAACAVERAPVRTATDAQIAQVRLSAIPATIAVLQSFPSSRPLPQDGRLAPNETTIYSVTATLIAYRVTPEAEIQLVLSDDARRTIIAKIPALPCAAGSRFLAGISGARATFEQRYTATDTFQETRQPIEVQGIGFFDFLHGDYGSAPNGFSLQPVTAIDFTPSFNPKPPPVPVRRRAVGIGGQRNCARPVLSLGISKATACSGETFSVSWQASDPVATVTIDGIGTGLPSSGVRTLTSGASTAYSGRAVTSCGASDESVAVVNVTASPTASVSGPAVISTGDSTTMGVSVSGTNSWTLSSSLGNPINPKTGTSSATVTYTATRGGTDVVTLSAGSSGCGSLVRTISITVSAPPPPPPSSGGLLCCDGTRSPSCFSCSNKSGCCSGHKGVCGCGS